jgi:hypothetical protein
MLVLLSAFDDMLQRRRATGLSVARALRLPDGPVSLRAAGVSGRLLGLGIDSQGSECRRSEAGRTYFQKRASRKSFGARFAFLLFPYSILSCDGRLGFLRIHSSSPFYIHLF